jgi:hypothetical protein
MTVDFYINTVITQGMYSDVGTTHKSDLGNVWRRHVSDVGNAVFQGWDGAEGMVCDPFLKSGRFEDVFGMESPFGREPRSMK